MPGFGPLTLTVTSLTLIGTSSCTLTLPVASCPQECLQADEHALDSRRLAVIDGPGVQSLLRRPKPLPLQDERARLLREVRSAAPQS